MIALIAPKRRKRHLAARLDDLQAWAPICDSALAPYSLTEHISVDAAAGGVQPDDQTVCVYCRRMIALVHILNRIDGNRGGGRHLHAA